MKNVLIASIIMLFAVCGFLYSAVQVVEVYVCEEELLTAELKAKVRVSRNELTRVSYCTCDGVMESFREEVLNSDKECRAPRDRVYSCICVGSPGY